MNIPLIVFNDVTGQYISGIESQRGAVSVARHVHDLSELLGIAQTGIVQAALIVSGTEQLNVSTLSLLQSYGIAVIVLRDPGDDVVLGHEHVVSSLAEVSEVIKEIEQAVEAGIAAPEPASNESADEPFTNAQSQTPAEEEPSKNGEVVTIWGSAGAPGRSTLAVQLAACAAEKGKAVCLIDADTYVPAIAGILGISEDYSTFSQLAHYAEKGALNRNNFKDTISSIKHGKTSFDVATGITSADRWPEIRQSAFERVLSVARDIYDYIVVDINHLVEADEEISFDGIVPLRNGCSITALEQADHLFVLGSADAIGIPRVLKSIDLLNGHHLMLSANTQVHVWINKLRASAIGNKPEQHLENAWNRYGGKYPIEGFISWDLELFDRMLLTGQTIFETQRKNPVAQSIEEMYQSVCPLPKENSLPEQGDKAENQPAIVIKRPHQSQKKSFLKSNFFARK